MFWIEKAYAMGAMGGKAAEGGGGTTEMLTSILPIVLMIAIFYLLLIRPQQKKSREHKAMLDAVKPGDRVVTTGGMHGRVAEVMETTVVVDLGSNCKITFERSAIQGIINPTPQKESKKDSKKESAKDQEKSE